MEDSFRALRQTARVLLRSRGFSAVVVLIVALGVGVNTAIYTAVDAVLLRATPYAELNRLVHIDRAQQDPARPVMPWTYAQFERVRGWTARPFDDVAAYGTRSVTVTGRGEPEQISVEFASRSYFAVLGVQPQVGAGWAQQPGGTDEIVLTHDYWQRRFQGAAGVIGSTVLVNRKPLTVRAVLPPRFRGESGEADAFVPLDAVATVTGDANALTPFAYWLNVIAKLPGTLQPAAAEARLPVLDRNWENEGVVPVAPLQGSLRVTPMRGSRIDPTVRGALLLTAGAALLVLLIACLNVSSLLLARSLRREREFAIRLAIGGSRAQLGRQLLLESMLLSVAGGALGIVFANWLLAVLAVLTPASTPGFWASYARAVSFETMRIDARVYAFALALTTGAALLIALLPALRAGRRSSFDTLRQGTSTAGVRHVRGRAALVVLQLALALVLLTSAGLLVRSLQLLQATDLRVQRENVLTVRLQLPRSSYSMERVRQFYAELLQRVQSEARVVSASVSESVPLAGGESTGDVSAAGRPPNEEEERADFAIHPVSPGYVRTMGMRVLSGRDFSATGEPVPAVLVNRTAARLLWPDRPAVQQRAALGYPLRDGTIAEVIGVVDDVPYVGIGTPVLPAVYVPTSLLMPRTAYVSVRTAESPEAFATRMRTHVRELDRDLPIVEVRTLEQHVSRATSRTRFGAVLLTTFAGLATLLAALGIYALLAQVVAESRREIGVRMALGGTALRMLALFLRRAGVLGAVGLGLGLLGSLGVTRLLRGQLYGVQPIDPTTWTTVVLLLGIITLGAAALPAVRAARTQPTMALRDD